MDEEIIKGVLKELLSDWTPYEPIGEITDYYGVEVDEEGEGNENPE